MSSNKQARRILITAGPAVAEIDRVRKITNHSTGSLGTDLTRFTVNEGHEVTLLRSDYCTAPEPELSHQQIPFSTGSDLLDKLQQLSDSNTFDAIWHAAAVNDYTVDRICDADGNNIDSRSKLPSRSGNITLHLKPFIKIIGELKSLFPNSYVVGWKYETEGKMEDVISKALQQLTDNKNHACVANGPAFGDGFGVCLSEESIIPAADPTELAMVLLGLLETRTA
ncbi:MAG: phosphopantothenoylcysteine decarboxylase [Verrucomicrobiota bacterium]